MRHQVHKFKFSGGKDSNDMMLRKLAYNLLAHGKMVTTEKKGKSLSSYMARLVEKSKEKTEANKNYLLRQMSSIKVVNTFFEKVGPVFKDIQGGYISLQRLQQRVSDGAMMVKLTWVKPVVLEEVINATNKVQSKIAPAKAESSAEIEIRMPEKTPAKKAKTVKKTK